MIDSGRFHGHFRRDSVSLESPCSRSILELNLDA
jgi:hypothetical protein